MTISNGKQYWNAYTQTDGHDGEFNLGYYDHNVAFQELIKEIPAADVAPVRHAEWVMTECVSEDTGIWWSWHCSNCGDTYDGIGKLDVRKHKYCHHCGAIMDGGTQDAID